MREFSLVESAPSMPRFSDLPVGTICEMSDSSIRVVIQYASGRNGKGGLMLQGSGLCETAPSEEHANIKTVRILGKLKPCTLKDFQ